MIVVVQTKFVGEFGSEAIAAVGIGQRVFFATQALLMAISAGTTALVARAWGAEDQEEASRVTFASTTLACVLSLACAIPGIVFARHITLIFGVDEVTSDLATQNIRWLLAFNVAFAVNFTIGAGLRAAGDAWSPFYIALVVNLVNIPLLYVLVLGNFGAPRLGVVGAAMAGGLAGTVGALISVVFWMRQKFRLKYIRSVLWDVQRFMQIARIGIPAGTEMLIFQVGYFAFLALLGWNYDTAAFAAYTIGGTMFMACMVVGFGFSIAGSTLAGQHLGAMDPGSAVKSGWASLGYAVLSMGSIATLIILNAEPIALFFLQGDPKTLEYTIQIAWIMALSTPLMAIEFAIGGALRGAGDTRFPMVATLICLLGVRVTGAILCVALQLPVVWLFATTLAEYSVKGALLITRFRGEKWKNLSFGSPTVMARGRMQ